MSTFHLFPKLPPEIRSQIWECALPTLEPGVHFFRAGCWTPRYLTPTDDEYERDDLDYNRYAMFDNTRINKTWLAVSIVDVNREARQAALRWAQGHHLQLCFPQERQELVFLRHYNLEEDTLYVTPGRWERFVQELMAPDDMRFMNNSFSLTSYIDRIVIPDSFFEEAIPTLRQMFQTHDLEALYVSETSLEPVSDGFDPSYQYEPSGGSIASWNSELQRFDFEAGNEEMDRTGWRQLLNQAAEALVESFAACRREKELSIMAVRLYRV
uniref:2EXR domain-containing protein n=1 Tax=Bionectria ochroleuca TaxID=29856 RepID=A0A8H7NE80_BIOOC